jgi:long-chain acyl-CoA synthetase
VYKHLGQVLPRSATRFGDKIALVIDTKAFSFRDLDRLTNRFANALVTLGVQPGDRVTLYAGNSWEWIVTYYAVLKAGGIINPVNVMLTPREVSFVVNDCGARIIVTSPDRAEFLTELDEPLPVDHIITFGDVPVGSSLALNLLIAHASDSFDSVDREPTDVSTIGYTSGTTGYPKGAMQTHQAVVINAAMTANMHVRTAADTVVTALPSAHVYGNVVLNGSLMTGGTLVLLPRFDAVRAVELIVEHRATIFDGVPTMYMYMLALPELGSYDFSSLTRCAVGGQTMPVAKMEEVEARFGCPLLELWGMTELSGLGSTHPAYGKRKLGSIGINLPYVECRIADMEGASRTLAVGEIGELMVRGPIVMKGYYGNEQATREALEPDGWLHSGDVGYMDEDGCIFIVDRKKDMILTGGFNVYPAEIERVLASHPAVTMCAVGSIPDELKGEIAKAYIVLKQGITASQQEIIQFCRARLAAYKVPRAVAFVEDLPKTSTGKIMRRELRNLDPTCN